jgi:hypothetical protein
MTFSKRLPVAGIVLLLSAPWAAAGALDDVGYTQLVNELTNQSLPIPDGSGMTVTQVEADVDEDDAIIAYLPNPASFSQTIIQKSGAYSISGHATGVGGLYYGSAATFGAGSSMAAGVSTVNAWNVYDETTNTGYLVDYLNADGAGDGDVAFDSGQVQNHSWVSVPDAEHPSDPGEIAVIMKRFDYAIVRDGFVGVVALNNGSNTVVPGVMASNYNGITVGITSGVHSRGGTLGEYGAAGRTKPDLVAPQSLTSFATPMVSSAATLLLSHAEATSGLENVQGHPQVTKSILMAGATKDDLPAAWTRTDDHPLDPIFGAGELNIYNSYHILAAGEHDASPSTAVPLQGWDYNEATTADSHRYFINVPVGQTVTELSAILAWNTIPGTVDDLGRAATVENPDQFIPSASVDLADLSLAFYLADGSYNLVGLPLQLSDSDVDNVEHIYLNTPLLPGQYAFEITGSLNTDYAFAWNATAVPEPSAVALLALGAIGLIRRRRL